MHVNHAKEFLKSVHSEALFSQLFDQAFTPLCKEPGILTSKLFDLMSLFGQDLPKNHLADYICDNCAASSTLCTHKILSTEMTLGVPSLKRQLIFGVPKIGHELDPHWKY